MQNNVKRGDPRTGRHKKWGLKTSQTTDKQVKTWGNGIPYKGRRMFRLSPISGYQKTFRLYFYAFKKFR